MKINFIKKPKVNQYSLFVGPPKFRETLFRTNEVIFDLSFRTKTQLYIAVQSEDVRFAFNEQSEYVKENNIKMAEKIEIDMLAGVTSENYYFKLTKKQNIEVLKKHIESLVDKLFREFCLLGLINKDSFTVNVYTPKEILDTI